MPGEHRWPALRRFAHHWEEASATGAPYDAGPASQQRRSSEGKEIPGVRVRLLPDRLTEAVARLGDIDGEGVLYRRVLIAISGGEAMSCEWIGPTHGLRPLLGGWRDPRCRRITGRRPIWVTGPLR